MQIDSTCKGKYREFTEAWERDTLSPYAVLSQNSKGRERPLPPCDLRTAFQRDRDRIIHCKSFRRLKHKTQVFLSPQGDHYRTRLTHTLEVSQIARTISRALRLNEDLTEAIAMGHDLGHTPFGHAGEEVLNELVPGGFEHNRQSLRVVEKLENGVGLNLTFEVRDGILHHKKSGTPSTLKVLSSVYRIVLHISTMISTMRTGAGDLGAGTAQGLRRIVLGASHGQRINSLIVDVVNESFFKPQILMSQPVNEAFEALRDIHV